MSAFFYIKHSHRNGDDADHCESSPEPVTSSIGLFCIESTTTLSRVGKIPENVFIFVEVKHVPRRRLVYNSPPTECVVWYRGVVFPTNNGARTAPRGAAVRCTPPTDVDKMLTSTLEGTGIGVLKYSNIFWKKAIKINLIKQINSSEMETILLL